MSDKVVVRFLKAWRGYSADELAGFDEAVADGLKSKGFAEAYEVDGAPGGKARSAKKNTGKVADKAPASPPTAGNEGNEGGEGGEGGNGDGDNNDNDEKP